VELSLSTFILELVNFLVLVWVLQRFLYRPVLEVIARRRERIDKTMADARQIETDADELKKRYEKRLEEWDRERSEARDRLSRELEHERTQQLAELRAALDDEKEKSRAAEAKRLADAEQKLEREALALGGRFASSLLGVAATPALEAKLIDQFLADLGATPGEQVDRLLGNHELPPEAIDVSSAYALSEAQRKAIGEGMRSLGMVEVPIRFAEDASLLAGLRVTVGSCVLGLNLRDELDGFARMESA
jgi:F-type H+-transporting ATPase subunit b